MNREVRTCSGHVAWLRNKLQLYFISEIVITVYACLFWLIEQKLSKMVAIITTLFIALWFLKQCLRGITFYWVPQEALCQNYLAYSLHRPCEADCAQKNTEAEKVPSANTHSRHCAQPAPSEGRPGNTENPQGAGWWCGNSDLFWQQGGK